MIVLKLANRELKNNLKYWSLFTLNLTIGLIGFAFILLFRDNISFALEERAKTMLSADLAISGRRSLSEDERKAVEVYLRGKKTEVSKIIELYSMGKTLNEKSISRLLLIKAVESNYPLIGNVHLTDGREFSPVFFQKAIKSNFVYISEEVAYQFNLKKTEKLKLGKHVFTVDGIIESDSTSVMRGFGLAPKVYIPKVLLDKTDLIQFGTVAWYSDFFMLKKHLSLEKEKLELEKRIEDPAIKVKSPRNSSQQLGRVIGYLSDYLGLIGVVALLISSVGGSYLFQNYIFERIKQIGILKSLGLSKYKITASFIIIILGLGLISTVITLIISQLLLPIALSFAKEWVSIDLTNQIGFDIFVIVFLIGVMTNLLICPPVLFQIFKLKTINLLNAQIGLSDKKQILFYIPALGFLWGLSIWQSHSFKIGSVFTFSLLSIFVLVLGLLPLLLNKLSDKLKEKSLLRPYSLAFGVAVRLMVRNRISTVFTILCLATGFSLISVIAQVDKGLTQELTTKETTRPSLFMFDIQDNQYEDLKEFALNHKIPLLEPTPMIRARLTKKNGVKVERVQETEGFRTREEDGERRFNNRGVNLSYSLELNDAESIVEGRPFSGVYSGDGKVEISLEKRYAKRLGVSVGDELTYNVLGVDVEGVIVNLRQVKWTSFLPNFFTVIQPGVLEDAPKTFLAAVKKQSKEEQYKTQDLIVSKFNNISIISVSELITKILEMFEAMAWAIGIMSFCCISVGIFVLFSIVQSQLRKKHIDFALQKIMGMSSQEIFKSFLWEYLTLVFISLFMGTCFGVIISYIVSILFLDGIFVFNFEFFFIFNLGALIFCYLVVKYTFSSYYNKSVNDLFQI